jgi:cyclopropane fatty-acyl-phospholipid synthase-like methyltransferase
MYAAKIGNRALGLSFDEENNKKAIRRAALLKLESIEFRNADLRELDSLVTSLGEFDQIMCLECIEHIENDQKLVRDLAVLLKPAGILILTTPYKHHKAYYGEAVSLAEDGGHVRWGYTHDELREILAESGLTVVAVDLISGFVTQKLASLRLRSLTFLPPAFVWLFTFMLRPLTILDRPLSVLLKYPYLAVGVVATKASH